MQTTIADSLSPSEINALEQAFRLEVALATSTTQCPLDIDDEIELLLGCVTSQYLWDRMWRFGIVLDDDAAKVRNLGSIWRNTEGGLDTGYYVPDDVDSTVQLQELAGPNRHDAIGIVEMAVT